MVNPALYQWYLGAIIGGVAVAIAVVNIVYSWKRAGETAAQTRQRKRVRRKLKWLHRVEPIPYEDDEQLHIDLEWATDEFRRASVWRWLACRFPSWGLPIRAMSFRDAEDAWVFVASVDGHRLAHRERRELFDDVETVVHALDAGEDPPPTISEYYYDDLYDGLTRIDETERRERGDCLTRIKENVRREGELEIEKLRTRLVDDFRYPEATFWEKLMQIKDRDVTITKDGYVVWQRYG